MSTKTNRQGGKSSQGKSVLQTDMEACDDYDRHLIFDHVVVPEEASQRERLEAVSRSLRDRLTHRWILTQQQCDLKNPIRVYNLSLFRSQCLDPEDDSERGQRGKVPQ